MPNNVVRRCNNRHMLLGCLELSLLQRAARLVWVLAPEKTHLQQQDRG
jgi:hypothetical protein